jgi:nucleoside-diphosphate-sugar epimerase
MSSGGTVYGNNPGEVNENSKVNPESFYAEMKVTSENLLLSMAAEYGVRVRICRLANMYGRMPSSPGNGLVDTAIHSSRIGRDVMIFRSLISRKQYGTFCDYAKYLLNFVQNSEIESKSTFYIENVFSAWDYSVEEIIDLVRSRMSNLGYNLGVKSENGSGDLVESVILHNSNPFKHIDHKWQNLQEFLENIK